MFVGISGIVGDWIGFGGSDGATSGDRDRQWITFHCSLGLARSGGLDIGDFISVVGSGFGIQLALSAGEARAQGRLFGSYQLSIFIVGIDYCLVDGPCDDHRWPTLRRPTFGFLQ